jgi:hypothetical protein
VTEAEFAAALLNPAHPLPAQMQHRFAVYRNNVVVSLTEALRAGFPVVETLVGPRFFAAMAVAFLRQHPPKGRLVMLYGDALPQFIADFPPSPPIPIWLMWPVWNRRCAKAITPLTAHPCRAKP